MPNSFELKELVGISSESISDAVRKAVSEAAKKGDVSWFEVLETRGRVLQDGEIEYQVKVKIGQKI